jgi:hypothetical protein
MIGAAAGKCAECEEMFLSSSKPLFPMFPSNKPSRPEARCASSCVLTSFQVSIWES